MAESQQKMSDQQAARQQAHLTQVQRKPAQAKPQASPAQPQPQPQTQHGQADQKPAEKPTDHKKAPKLDINFWDEMAPQKGRGKHVSLNKDQLTSVLADGKYALLSAGRNPNHEQDKKLQDGQIEARYEKMREDLREKGYKFTEVMGHYGAPEKSFLVMAPDRNDIANLGKKYNQDSVIYAESGKQEMHFTTGDSKNKSHFGQGWKEVPDAQDYYTEVPLTNGQKIKFSLNFDFGRHHADPATRWKSMKGE